MTNSSREELIQDIKEHCTDECGYISASLVAEFILEDRKRIVEPLVTYKQNYNLVGEGMTKEAIDQTLKNAGVL